MTYYGSRELSASFRTVRGNTVRIAEEIPSFSFHVHGEAGAEVNDLAKVDFPELMPTRRRRRASKCSWAPKEHEMHHRGQIMMQQRMVGIVPHLTRRMQERMAQAQAARAR